MNLRALAWVSSFGCGLLACAPPPLPPKKVEHKVADPMIDHDKGVNVDVARKLLARAEDALKQNEIPSVKRLCEQAEPFADESVREEIRSILQRADQRVAKDLSPPILELAKSGECQQAAELSLAIVLEHRGTTVARFLRDEVSKPILTCLLDALAIDVSVARELSEAGALKKALNVVDFEHWDSKLDESIVGSLVVGLQGPIAARNWSKAGAQLDEMVARKEAGPREVARVLKVIRAGVTEDVQAKAEAGLGVKSGAPGLLKTIDALIGAGRWSEADPVPEALEQRHREAAFWATCAAQDCSFIAPRLNWSYGTLEPRPVLDVTGTATERVKHARKVWKLTDGRPLVLIADHDPGVLVAGVQAGTEPRAVDAIAARIPVGLGWVPVQNLAATDTAERLPPGAALAGTRVWGPLRDRVKEWEIGVVLDATGDTLSVERASDGKTVSARRSDVRFGSVRVGMKVLALCVHTVRLEPAVIDEVVPTSSGEPRLKLSCLDEKGQKNGVSREILLGSVRSQAAWIPSGS